MLNKAYLPQQFFTLRMISLLIIWSSEAQKTGCANDEDLERGEPERSKLSTRIYKLGERPRHATISDNLQNLRPPRE